MYKIIDYFIHVFSPEDKNQVVKKDLSAKEENTQVVQEAVKMHLGSPPSPPLEGMKADTAIQKNPQSPTKQKVQEATVHLASRSPVSETAVPMSSVAEVSSSSLRREQPAWNSFEQVTRYLPNCQALLATAVSDEEIEGLCSSLQEENWLEILENYQGSDPAILARNALIAFHKGNITVEQFCTVTHLAALLKEFPDSEISIQPLFDGRGQPDVRARQAMQQGLYKEYSINFFTRSESERVLNDFFENMKTKLPSEQWFFYIDRIPQEPVVGGRQTIHTVAESALGLRIFDHFTFGSDKVRMIPSFSMIQAATKAYGQDNAIDPWPTIAASTRADLRRNIDEDGRDTFVPFEGVACPQFADGFRVMDSFDFLLHDVYHDLTCSQVPSACRKETGRLADTIASLQGQFANDQDPIVGPFLETLYGRMIDMDFPLFRAGYREMFPFIPQDITEGELLLLEMERQIIDVTSQRILLKLETLTPVEKRVGLSDSAVASLQKWDKINEKINAHMLEAHTTRDNALNEIAKDFYANSPVQEELARSIYDSGFLNRLNLSPESLNRVQSLTTQLMGVSSNVLLSHRLLSIHRDRRSEQKAEKP